MGNKSLLYFSALVLTVVFGAFALATAMDGQESSEETETAGVASKCLACHGSYDDIAKATAEFTAPSGETTTPHRYIPHDDPEGIPECTECHKPHEIPLEDVSTVVKPDNLDFCYAYCHHAQNLQPCSACH